LNEYVEIALFQLSRERRHRPGAIFHNLANLLLAQSPVLHHPVKAGADFGICARGMAAETANLEDFGSGRWVWDRTVLRS
jgi:hypothetical protein